MKQFEFKLVAQPDTGAEAITILNHYGSQGWELAAKDYGAFIMQREIVFEVGGMSMQLPRPELERPGINELLNS